MDISEKYIKMCRTEEIQERWVPADGDFYAYPGGYHDSPVFIWGSRYMDKDLNKAGLTVLLRQDQLQAILASDVTIGYMIVGLDAFYDPESQCGHIEPCEICKERGVRRRLGYDTMEQWYLAFVMYEKFGLEWDATEEKWVVME